MPPPRAGIDPTRSMVPTPDTPDSEKPSEPARRKPFEGQAQPESSLRTPEFQRFVWLLAGVLAVVGIMGYSALSGAARKTSSAQGSAPSAAAALV